MAEVEKETDINSFVFYRSFHEAAKSLDPADYGALMYAVNEYALNKREPVIDDPLIKSMFTLIKPQIEANWRRRENKIYGKLGGAPRGNQNAKKQPNGLNLKQPKTTQRVDFETTQNNPNVNVNVNVNDNVNANVNVNERESAAALAKDSLSSSENNFEESSAKPKTQDQICHELFELFQDNDLPCENNDEKAFKTFDFNEAMIYIANSEKLSSRPFLDVLRGIYNYVETLKNEESYITNKYSLDRLVKTQQFIDFLPANFKPENFLKKGVEQSKKPSPTINYFKKYKAPRTCKFCSGATEEAGVQPYVMKCSKCNAFATYIENDKCWSWELPVSEEDIHWDFTSDSNIKEG